MAVHSTLSAPGQQPCHFLDLPKELRFIVYSLLATTSSHRLALPAAAGCVASTFTYTLAPFHLICKRIHHETSSMVARHRKRVSTLRMALEFNPLETPDLDRKYFARCVGKTMRLLSRFFRYNTAEEVLDAWWMQHNQVNKADLKDMWEGLHDSRCSAMDFALYKPSNADEGELKKLFVPSLWLPVNPPPGEEFWHSRELTLSVYDGHCAPVAAGLVAPEQDHGEGRIYHECIDGEYATYLHYTAVGSFTR